MMDQPPVTRLSASAKLPSGANVLMTNLEMP